MSILCLYILFLHGYCHGHGSGTSSQYIKQSSAIVAHTEATEAIQLLQSVHTSKVVAGFTFVLLGLPCSDHLGLVLFHRNVCLSYCVPNYIHMGTYFGTTATQSKDP
jgi:hypothetical protein